MALRREEGEDFTPEVITQQREEMGSNSYTVARLFLFIREGGRAFYKVLNKHVL